MDDLKNHIKAKHQSINCSDYVRESDDYSNLAIIVIEIVGLDNLQSHIKAKHERQVTVTN